MEAVRDRCSLGRVLAKAAGNQSLCPETKHKRHESAHQGSSKEIGSVTSVSNQRSRLAVSQAFQGGLRTSRDHTCTSQGTSLATQRKDRTILPHDEGLDAVHMDDPVNRWNAEKAQRVSSLVQ